MAERESSVRSAREGAGSARMILLAGVTKAMPSNKKRPTARQEARQEAGDQQEDPGHKTPPEGGGWGSMLIEFGTRQQHPASLTRCLPLAALTARHNSTHEQS